MNFIQLLLDIRMYYILILDHYFCTDQLYYYSLGTLIVYLMGIIIYNIN